MPGFPDDTSPISSWSEQIAGDVGTIPAGGVLSVPGPFPTAGFAYLTLYYQCPLPFCYFTFAQEGIATLSAGVGYPTRPLSPAGWSVTVRNLGESLGGIQFGNEGAVNADMNWQLYGTNDPGGVEQQQVLTRIHTPGAATLVPYAGILHSVVATNNTNVDGQYVNIGDRVSGVSAGLYDTRISLRAYETKQLTFPDPGWLLYWNLSVWNSGAVNGDVEISAVYSTLR